MTLLQLSAKTNIIINTTKAFQENTETYNHNYN